MYYSAAPLGDLPVGLAMALAENLPAMTAFSQLPRSHQKDLIRRAQSAVSKEEMQSLVHSLLT